MKEREDPKFKNLAELYDYIEKEARKRLEGFKELS